MMKWRDAVWLAVQREARSESGQFTRQSLLDHQLEQMRADTLTGGKTPEQTISRTLQELAREGAIIFLGRGEYRISTESKDAPTADEALRTERIAQIAARVGQGPFRQKLLQKFDGACPLTKISEPGLLRASHIIPWAKCWPQSDRHNPDNGLLLSALWDAAFDRGFVTFADDGRALVGCNVQLPIIQQLRASPCTTLPTTALPEPVRVRLARHRSAHRSALHVDLLNR